MLGHIRNGVCSNESGSSDRWDTNAWKCRVSAEKESGNIRVGGGPGLLSRLDAGAVRSSVPADESGVGERGAHERELRSLPHVRNDLLKGSPHPLGALLFHCCARKERKGREARKANEGRQPARRVDRIQAMEQRRALAIVKESE